MSIQLLEISFHEPMRIIIGFGHLVPTIHRRIAPTNQVTILLYSKKQCHLNENMCENIMGIHHVNANPKPLELHLFQSQELDHSCIVDNVGMIT